MLVIVTAYKKFYVYIWNNKNILIENNHKYLESIFKKPLHQVPFRLQKMLLEVITYNLKVSYEKETELVSTDSLSKDYNIKKETEADPEKIVECECG